MSDEQPPRIQDIPSFAKLIQHSKTLSVVKNALPIAAPLLKLLGVDTSKASDGVANADDLRQQIEDLTKLPDRFNTVFAERGWIIYNLMSVEAAKAALDKAIAGYIDEAEADLVEYYSPETVRWKLRTLRSIEAFRPRMRLAEKALEDYEAGRYHASIPVILALMDGFVNDLHTPKKGFFAEGTNLIAWNSITAHEKGLGALHQIFKKGRYATTTEEITLPYRNGILHGMDLGYDTKIVAAKTWGALFAVRDWAQKAEKDELQAPPEEPAPTLGKVIGDLIQHTQKMGKLNQELERWTPREIVIGTHIPAQGEPDEYTEGTPEKLLVEYLTYWRKKNFGYMAKHLSEKYAVSSKDAIRRIREEYNGKALQSFAIESIDDKAPAVTEITTVLHYTEGSEHVEKRHTFRLIYMDEESTALPRSLEGGRWQVITWLLY